MKTYKINREQLEDLLREQYKEMRDYPDSGIRTPIFFNTENKSVYAGGYLSVGQWVEGRVELPVRVTTWTTDETEPDETDIEWYVDNMVEQAIRDLDSYENPNHRFELV